jgi:hypothetical protein
MFRLLITILVCLMYFIWGLVGDELLNISPYRHQPNPPWLTQFLIDSFPLNRGYFFYRVSTVFCASQLIVLLLTASKKPIIAPHHFAEGTFLVLVLFGLYFGCFVLALIIPFHIMGMSEGKSTALNIITSVLNYALWLAVFALVGRLIVNRFR